MTEQGSKSAVVGGKKLKAASFSIGVNVFLISMKLVVAFMTGSLAILAELAHSIFDMVASVFAYFGIKKANEPDDSTHHFGHEKFENLSALAQTFLIVITSIVIIYEAIDRIMHPKPIEATEIGLIAMVVTMVIAYFFSKYLHKSSEEYGSHALESDAYHFTTDLWGAIAVIIGLGFVLMGFQIADSIAAIVVALLMLWISYTLGKKSINVLMDKSPSNSVMEKICSIITSTPGVTHFHKLRARHAGSKLLVELHIQVSSNISVLEGHDIAHNVKDNIIKEFPDVKEVTIHVEPDVLLSEEENEK